MMQKFNVRDFDTTFYQRQLDRISEWQLSETLDVPPLGGNGCRVGRGQVLRISQPEGPQVCDFNAFSSDDPSEHFWSGRTRILESPHLGLFNRLWSTRVRPMFTIIVDTVRSSSSAHGGRNHDLLFARCSRELWMIVKGVDHAPNCQDNMARAASAFGVEAQHVHDAFNLFTKTGIDPHDHCLFIEACDSRKGDHVDLYAEMDCIVALSACPAGDGADEPTHRPLQAQVFDLPQMAE